MENAEATRTNSHQKPMTAEENSVLLSLDDDEPDVDDPVDIANALCAIRAHTPNLLHAVDRVVNLPVVLQYLPKNTSRLLPRLSKRLLAVSYRLPVISRTTLLPLHWRLNVSTESAISTTGPYVTLQSSIQPVPLT